MSDAPLRELFRTAFGADAEAVSPIQGDGSARRIFRLKGAGRSAVGVLHPERRENEAFLGFSRSFRAAGLPVPEVYAEDLDRGAYLEEDLGDTTLFELLSRERTPSGPGPRAVEVYRKALRLLPRFQFEAGKGLDYGLCWPRSSFDRQSMMWDLNYFKYYFLRLSGVALDEQGLEDDFEALAAFLLEAGRDAFLYRDFQSRNVMVRDGAPWFIDYQGGRKGAPQYDVASLLYDAKADLPFDLRESLLEEYLEAAPVDRERFLRYFPGFVYIRIMQAMGAYGLRGFYERKSHFLLSIPYAVRNLEHLLRTAELPVRLPALTEVFRRIVGSSALRQFGSASLELTVRVQSFSYKKGFPADTSGHGGGYVFDCRALPNPGRDPKLAQKTGRDGEIVRYLEAAPEVGRFLEDASRLVLLSVANYRTRNFSDLSVAFGCTGGRHRSVYCAERLAERLRAEGVRVQLGHRELEA